MSTYEHEFGLQLLDDYKLETAQVALCLRGPHGVLQFDALRCIRIDNFHSGGNRECFLAA